jgi:hypothetical protein
MLPAIATESPAANISNLKEHAKGLPEWFTKKQLICPEVASVDPPGCSRRATQVSPMVTFSLSHLSPTADSSFEKSSGNKNVHTNVGMEPVALVVIYG